jgi:hypothetical protein
VITSIAASLLIIILVGKLTGLQVNYSQNELRLSFGEPVQNNLASDPNTLSATEVQQMIDNSLHQNNEAMQASLKESQQKYEESVKNILARSNVKTSELVRTASSASEEQVRQYVLTMREENTKQMRDYMQLSTNEQKQYIEDLLVDFAKYMQQQRNNDLMTLQTRLATVEQNTDMFQRETEQILTSIIANVDKEDNSVTKY